jgi:hypothetical protein
MVNFSSCLFLVAAVGSGGSELSFSDYSPPLSE